MSRALAEMMPTVTEPPKPNGLPIAITQSPTLMASELPNFTAGNGFFGITFNSAMSVLGSRPTTFSTFSLLPSAKLAAISSAPSMTCTFVTIRPSLPSMTKPEPSEETLRSGPPPLPDLKKSSKNSSNGDPLGTRGSAPPDEPLTVWLVEMLTTADCRRSAIGATDCGPRAIVPVSANPSRHAAHTKPRGLGRDVCRSGIMRRSPGEKAVPEGLNDGSTDSDRLHPRVNAS